MVDNLRTGSILLPTGVFLIFMKTGACHHFSPQGMTRRSFLQGTACGFDSLPLNALPTQEMSVSGSAHFPARAKRVILPFLHGGVSQVDSFDHTPRLAAEHGRPLPFKPLANLDPTKDGKMGKVFAYPRKFRRAGQSGNWVSDLWPHVGKQIDDLFFIKSMETLGTSHGQTVSMLHTGADSLVRPSLGARASHELAFRMQGVAPDLLKLPDEPDHIRSPYGLEKNHTAEFGSRCLPARRFCEAGVRFVQVSPPYVWDHNPASFTIWLAGAGVKAGHRHGSTDDCDYYAEQDKVPLHDLRAPLLHLTGLDHERLTCRYGGRDFRLTDVYGQVVREVLS